MRPSSLPGLQSLLGHLQATANLSPANWMAVTNFPLTLANHNSVTDSTGSSARFYRLIYP